MACGIEHDTTARDRARAVGGGPAAKAVAGEMVNDQRLDVRLVFDDQDLRRHARRRQACSRCNSSHVAAAISAEAGMVRIHVVTIRPATPQRTAEKCWIAPTPMIEPLIVCVVLTGMPPIAVPRSVIAPAASAQNPPTGRSLVMRIPIVFTMRQPPAIVPRPIAACAARITQNGT